MTKEQARRAATLLIRLTHAAKKFNVDFKTLQRVVAQEGIVAIPTAGRDSLFYVPELVEAIEHRRSEQRRGRPIGATL